jgi:hypothetical protein
VGGDSAVPQRVGHPAGTVLIHGGKDTGRSMLKRRA